MTAHTHTRVTAATPMEDPYCSCKLTQLTLRGMGQHGGRRRAGGAAAAAAAGGESRGDRMQRGKVAARRPAFPCVPAAVFSQRLRVLAPSACGAGAEASAPAFCLKTTNTTRVSCLTLVGPGRFAARCSRSHGRPTGTPAPAAAAAAAATPLRPGCPAARRPAAGPTPAGRGGCAGRPRRWPGRVVRGQREGEGGGRRAEESRASFQSSALSHRLCALCFPPPSRLRHRLAAVRPHCLRR